MSLLLFVDIIKMKAYFLIAFTNTTYLKINYLSYLKGKRITSNAKSLDTLFRGQDVQLALMVIKFICLEERIKNIDSMIYGVSIYNHVVLKD